MIPTDRPVTINDVRNLQEKLGLPRDDFLFALGTWTGFFYEGRKAPNEPLHDVATALLTRWLDRYPDDVPFPPTKTVQEFSELLTSLMGDEITPRILAVALGCDVSAGYRWDQISGQTTLSIRRIVTMLHRKVQKHGHRAFSEEWIRIVSEEAIARGAPNIWSHGDWPYSKKKGAKKALTGKQIEKGYSLGPRSIQLRGTFSPVTGNDLLSLREKLGLTAMEFQFVLGISGFAFAKLVKEDQRSKPLYDPSIALMARWLDKYPEDAEVPIAPSFNEFFDTLNKMIGGSLTLKEVAIAFGKQPSAGHRWSVSHGAAIGTLNRILTILFPKIRRMGPDVYTKDWHELVEIEAQARGIKHIWRHGIWGRKRNQAGKSPEEIAVIEEKLDAKPKRKVRTALRLGKPRRSEMRDTPKLVLNEAKDVAKRKKARKKA